MINKNHFTIKKKKKIEKVALMAHFFTSKGGRERERERERENAILTFFFNCFYYSFLKTKNRMSDIPLLFLLLPTPVPRHRDETYEKYCLRWLLLSATKTNACKYGPLKELKQQDEGTYNVD